MVFKTEAQRICYEKVAPWLKEIFGEFAKPLEDEPVFLVAIGSTVSFVRVIPWGDDDAIIRTTAFVVSGAKLEPDLMDYLLRENVTMRFGSFGINDENNIIFHHSIIGSTCDKKELATSVKRITMIADEYDDKIVSKWGGQRALDKTE